MMAKIIDKDIIKQYLDKFPELDNELWISYEIIKGLHCSVWAQYPGNHITMTLIPSDQIDLLSNLKSWQVEKTENFSQLYKELWEVYSDFNEKNIESTIKRFDEIGNEILKLVKYIAIYQHRNTKDIARYQRYPIQVSKNIFFHYLTIDSLKDTKEMKSIVNHYPEEEVRFFSSVESVFRYYITDNWEGASVLFFDGMHATVQVPDSKKGLFIGRRGDTVNTIAEHFGVKIKVV